MLFNYQINQNFYFQEELKFIQFRELVELLKPYRALILETDNEISFDTIMQLLGKDLLKAIAIVIIPEGKTARERNIEQTIADLESESLTTVEEIIKDFFSCNNMQAHIGAITDVINSIFPQQTASYQNQKSKKSLGAK